MKRIFLKSQLHGNVAIKNLKFHNLNFKSCNFKSFEMYKPIKRIFCFKNTIKELDQSKNKNFDFEQADPQNSNFFNFI